uniref:Uncharacterized protein n=1 Tax=Rhizophora mucronata TaxID=61149 RepID=A0A2P2Q900_RHIMU
MQLGFLLDCNGLKSSVKPFLCILIGELWLDLEIFDSFPQFSDYKRVRAEFGIVEYKKYSFGS